MAKEVVEKGGDSSFIFFSHNDESLEREVVTHADLLHGGKIYGQ